MESVFGTGECKKAWCLTQTHQRKTFIVTSVLLKRMEVHKFTAAVRGFHYYRRFWRPKESEELDCIYEPDNVFDRFAIKTVTKDGDTVGHLPKEI